MATSRKNRTGKRSHMEARRTKALYLPMPRTEVDPITLRFRLALERIRGGQADRETVNHIGMVVMLAGFITEEGHGLLELAVFKEARRALRDILQAGYTTQVWAVGEPVLDLFTCIVNEHDRQLRETRLQVIVAASRRLDALLDRHLAVIDLSPCVGEGADADLLVLSGATGSAGQ